MYIPTLKKTTILQLQLSNNHSSKEIHEYLGNLRGVLICPVHFNCLSNHIPGTRNTLVLHTHSPTGLLRFYLAAKHCTLSFRVCQFSMVPHLPHLPGSLAKYMPNGGHSLCLFESAEPSTPCWLTKSSQHKSYSFSASLVRSHS